MTMSRNAALAAAIAGASAVAAPQAFAETPVGSNVDSRLILAFDAPDAAVQALLPEGWRPVQMPGGPFGGADVLFVLIDRHLQRGPDGAPADPSAMLSSALVAPAVKEGVEGSRLFVLKQFETAPMGDAYGVSVAAEMEHHSELAAGEDGARIRRDEWSIEPAGGGEFEVELRHVAGVASWAPGEALPHSAARPDFHRIYRFEQLVDVAMSRAMGKALDGSIEIEVEGGPADFAALFDGSETLVGVMSIPVYVREVSLP